VRRGGRLTACGIDQLLGELAYDADLVDEVGSPFASAHRGDGRRSCQPTDPLEPVADGQQASRPPGVRPCHSRFARSRRPAGRRAARA
jgi:hypothetical protein